ncbi:hypothetical protein C0584_00245 [Candidatus Parcubacteria bacterium]|nr:MAG: hypothetical protein C0584_00245 [Candidatus Parcubacteria bacterium]
MKKISVKKALIILSVLAVIAIIIISAMARGSKDLNEYTTITLERGDLIQTVSETGIIKTSDSFDLSFEQGGKISVIQTEVGQEVEKDQVIAELDHSALDIRLAQTRASLDIANANLTKLRTGATSQEIAIYEASYNRAKSAYDSSLTELETYQKSLDESIAQATKTLYDLENTGAGTPTVYEQALDAAETNLENTETTYQQGIDNSITSSLNIVETQTSAINNSLDQINSIINEDDYEDYLSVKNKTYLSNARKSYDEAIVLLDQTNLNTPKVKAAPHRDNVKNLLQETLDTLNKTYLSLNNSFSALENSVTGSAFSKTTLDGLKTIINTQIGIISASITSTQSAIQSLDSAILTYDTRVDTANDTYTQAKTNLDNAITTAKNNLTNVKNNGDQQLASLEGRVESANQSLFVAQAELNRVKSPARAEDISLYQAQYRQAEAELNSVTNQIEKTKLKAPIDGVVSKINFEVGEQYNVGRVVATVISETEYRIDVDISESDIPKVKIGDEVSITLDALSEDVKFIGSVSFIEPAETVIQDVIYYKVEITFDSANGNLKLVKPGMTANVEITTNEKISILAIPGRAIIDRNGDGKFVKTYNNNVIEEKKVKIGIIGDGGMVEIISGLEEGDEVVTFTKEK